MKAKVNGQRMQNGFVLRVAAKHEPVLLAISPAQQPVSQ